jgi:histidyl-tRNA synthetase
MRQFHQFGAEAIGSQSAASDAEVISLSVEIYRKLGVNNFEVRINSVGCEQCRPSYKQTLQSYLRNILDKLSEDSQKRFEQNPLRILDSKNENDIELTKDAPLIKDFLCTECSNHFEELQRTLRLLEVQFSIDGRIVRGLDYYTKTAYEIVSSDLGSQDALAGGGRYDLLVKEIGGKQTPSVGFAAGIERLIMAMEKQNADFGKNLFPKVFIAAADDIGRSWAMETAMKLRKIGISCEIDLLNRSLKAQMREADRQQAKFVIIAGVTEVKEQIVPIKNMATGEQSKVAIANLLDHFQNRKDE